MAVRLYEYENELLFSNLKAAFKTTHWYNVGTLKGGRFETNYWENFKYWLWADFNLYAGKSCDDDYNAYNYISLDTDEQRVEFLLKWL